MKAASAQRFLVVVLASKRAYFPTPFFFHSHLTPLNQTAQETWPVIQREKKKKTKQNVIVDDILGVSKQDKTS